MVAATNTFPLSSCSISRHLPAWISRLLILIRLSSIGASENCSCRQGFRSQTSRRLRPSSSLPANFLSSALPPSLNPASLSLFSTPSSTTLRLLLTVSFIPLSVFAFQEPALTCSVFPSLPPCLSPTMAGQSPALSSFVSLDTKLMLCFVYCSSPVPN